MLRKTHRIQFYAYSQNLYKFLKLFTKLTFINWLQQLYTLPKHNSAKFLDSMLYVWKILYLMHSISGFMVISAVEMEQLQDSVGTDLLISNVSQNLVQVTKKEVDSFLSNPTNETLVNLLNSLALPLGRVIQVVVGSGMSASESANLVGLIVGEWMNSTVEANLTTLHVTQVEDEVVGTVQNSLNQSKG
eukprot:TRINITY_DN624_c0_g1_i2.p1 TRINITY_DN624_c0_g1~~TRINITY_DN624_c0_g1_i2.p1  ORF type:complete len:189 (-),score=17.66 TRINITY_DN624_c0_g1_i2:413-979(-)